MDHSGHRERLRSRFLREGLDGFEAEKVLELLLFYAIPRKDTAPIAAELIGRFGSLAGVLEAPMAALLAVPGMGEGAAEFLQLLHQVSRYSLTQQYVPQRVLDTVERCADYIIPRLYGLREEHVALLCLDAQCRVLSCKLLGRGGINSANVPIRRIVEEALSCGAVSVVLAHNHPSGVALPSEQDVDATRKVLAALDSVGVALGDHLIIALEDYTSMAETGLLGAIWHKPAVTGMTGRTSFYGNRG